MEKKQSSFKNLSPNVTQSDFDSLELKLNALIESKVIEKVEDAKVDIEQEYREQITSMQKQVKSGETMITNMQLRIDKLNRQADILKYDLKNNYEHVQIAKQASNNIKDLERKITAHHNKLQGTLDKYTAFTTTSKHILAEMNTDKNDVESMKEDIKQNQNLTHAHSKKFSTWTSNALKMHGEIMKTELQSCKQVFQDKLTIFFHEGKVKQDTFVSNYSEGNAVLYAKSHAKAAANKIFHQMEEYQMQMSTRFQETWENFTTHATTETENITLIGKHNATIINAATDTFLQDSEILLEMNKENFKTQKNSIKAVVNETMNNKIMEIKYLDKPKEHCNHDLNKLKAEVTSILPSILANIQYPIPCISTIPDNPCIPSTDRTTDLERLSEKNKEKSHSHF